MDFITEKYTVKKLRQTEVEDIFEVTFTDGRETDYIKFPRTMEMTCEDASDWVDEEGETK